jgi:hypothetical protein
MINYKLRIKNLELEMSITFILCQIPDLKIPDSNDVLRVRVHALQLPFL